jgi:hypothetical protein
MCWPDNPDVGKIQFDHTRVTPQTLYNNPELRAELLAYLQRDVDVLLDVVQHFTRLFASEYRVDFKKLYSASNAAMRVFRTLYLKNAQTPEGPEGPVPPAGGARCVPVLRAVTAD